MTKKTTNSVELPNTAGDNNVPPDNVGGGAATPPRTSPSDDPFDLRNLRIDQTFLTGSAEKLISSFSVRKPKKNSFFRVHPGEDYQAATYIYQDKDEGGMEKETYLVIPAFAYQLEDAELKAFRSVKLHLAIERHAEKPFVWPVGFPSRGGKDNEFWRTAREAAERAKTEWLRIDAGEGSYDFYRPRIEFGDPIWPRMSFSDILRIAFKNRVINGPDHIVMQTLRGEV